jgi:4-hydroxy-4-methyl-2-oxoglutarate aldolase
VRGTDKQGGGHINVPIVIGDITINPGDLVVGDRDGVVIVPAGEVTVAMDAAQRREAKEDQIKRDLLGGKSTLEIYAWPPAK